MVRYELGNMDRYGIAVNGTVMENASFFSITFKNVISKQRLIDATNMALQYHPLFKTHVIYDKQYVLEENSNPICIVHASEQDRPKEFGRSTNGYPWQLSYYDRTVCFEWCHVITDGRGAIAFLSTILDVYFEVLDEDVPKEFPLERAFEHFYDKNVESFGQIKQKAGFRAKDFKAEKNGFRCTSHILSIETTKLLKISKKIDSTPAAILAPLLCKAIRSRIPKTIKNRNVSCGIVVDCRKPMKFQTMHNFVLNKVITYTDRFDKMDIETLGTVYRGILDIFTQKENIISGCTDMIRQTEALYHLRPLKLQRIIMKIVASITKERMNNIGLTYLGKVPFKPDVCKQLDLVGFRSWPDIGNCVMAVIDLNGMLYIDICENYCDKEVVNAFVNTCREYGIILKYEKEAVFEQAAMKV